ncbi:MAG: lipopolysaccharide biosynthesis protein [Ekhidna sp.]|nr:lipopolysaccharide biosynthesis protein [Ekhidna sp.]
MGVIIKQSFWGTVIAYIGVVVGYINTLYFRAEYFDLSQIGLFTLITSHAMMISPLSSLGMSNSFIKYFSSFEKKDQNTFFTLLFLVTCFGCGIVLLTGYAFKDQIVVRYTDSAPEYINYLWITAMVMVANSFFDIFFSLSRTILKVVFPSFLRDVYLRIGSLLLVIGYASSWWSFSGVVSGLGITYLSAFIILFIKLSLFDGFRFNFSFAIVGGQWRTDLAKFGSYAMLMAGSFAIINNSSYDQVTAVLGADMNGVFTTCFFIAVIVEMPRRNIVKVIAPIISSEIERNNIQEVENLYKRGSITMSIIGLLLMIGICTNLQDLFDFIPKGESFQVGFYVVIAVCFAKLITMMGSFSGEILNFSPYYRYNLLFQIMSAILLIGMNDVLLPKYGLNGAGSSYLTAIAFQSTLKYFWVKVKMGIQPFTKQHLPLLVIAVSVALAAYFFQPGMHPILNIILRSILTSIIFIVAIFLLKISSDINKIIHSTFERFLNVRLPK